MRGFPSPGAIDTRTVFRAYGAAAITLGFFGADGNFLLPRGLSEALMPAYLVLHPSRATEFGWYVVPRVVGAALLAIGLIAYGIARVADPETRRRLLNRFAVAHIVGGWIFQGVTSAIVVPLPYELTWLPLLVGGVLGYCAFAAAPAAVPATGAATLEAQYEEQIRRAARREERARLARDLHDAVRQHLFAIQTAAATVDARLDTDQAGARTAVEHVRLATRMAMTEMDALIDQQAAPMENAGLVEALRTQCEALGFRTGATVRFTVGTLPTSESLTPGTQEALYRFAQEALANVGRHARAKNVTVSLGLKRSRVELSVADDGAGFVPWTHHSGSGQRNMAARAKELEGRCVIRSAPGEGASVRCLIPYGRAATVADTKRMLRWTAWVLGVGFLMFGLGSPISRVIDFLTVFAIVLGIAAAIGGMRLANVYLRARTAG